MSGNALTSVILIRNTMSFAIGYGITPWLDNLGERKQQFSAWPGLTPSRNAELLHFGSIRRLGRQSGLSSHGEMGQDTS